MAGAAPLISSRMTCCCVKTACVAPRPSLPAARGPSPRCFAPYTAVLCRGQQQKQFGPVAATAGSPATAARRRRRRRHTSACSRPSSRPCRRPLAAPSGCTAGSWSGTRGARRWSRPGRSGGCCAAAGVPGLFLLMLCPVLLFRPARRTGRRSMGDALAQRVQKAPFDVRRNLLTAGYGALAVGPFGHAWCAAPLHAAPAAAAALAPVPALAAATSRRLALERNCSPGAACRGVQQHPLQARALGPNLQYRPCYRTQVPWPGPRGTPPLHARQPRLHRSQGACASCTGAAIVEGAAGGLPRRHAPAPRLQGIPCALPAKPRPSPSPCLQVVADTAIFGPLHVAGYFTHMTLCEGGGLPDVGAKLRSDFWPTFSAELTVWPVVQASGRAQGGRRSVAGSGAAARGHAPRWRTAPLGCRLAPAVPNPLPLGSKHCFCLTSFGCSAP